MKNILITGHKGFIGTHLWDHWANKYRLTGFDKGNVLPDEYFDVVVHLAALSGVRESWKNPWGYFKNNVLLSRKILNKYKKVIYASSSTAKEPWRNPYALSKRMVEAIAPANSLGVRLTTVYGPNSRKNMFLTRLLEGRLDYVNTDCSRDFIHIEDVLRFFDIAVESEATGVINVGTGISTPVADLAPDGIAKRTSPFYEMKDNRANLKFAQSLGFEPTVDVRNYVVNCKS